LKRSIQKIEHPTFIVIFFLVGLLILFLPFVRTDEVPFLLLFLGRLHPLVLHFPIVLIILCLLLEATRFFHILRPGEGIVTLLLIAAALSTLTSIGAGFFLFASGDYAGDLIEGHFWAGAITGSLLFATLGFYFLYRRLERYYGLYLGALLLTSVSVGYASHLGGSVTHGKDYLTEHLTLLLNEESPVENKDESEMLVYDDMIVPILESKCYSCHNDQKAKGDFKMTSYQKIFKKGESGKPSISPGVPEESELLTRINLPDDHKDHMPPAGKTPLNPDEEALLTYWITTGAEEFQEVQPLRTADIGPVVERLLPALARYRRSARLTDIKDKVLHQELSELADKLFVIIERDSMSDDNLFAMAMKFPPAPFGNDQFILLKPYYEVFSKLSLTSSGIDDEGLYYVGKMTNLKSLFLQKTKLDGSGLVYLQGLSQLEVLNLSFTNVDDMALIDLLEIPNLREVYLYRTNTTKAVIDAIGRNRPHLKLLVEEGPYF
jgi:uncharacterized membrane protein